MPASNAALNESVDLLDDGLEVEEILGLEEFADEPQGAWPKGWYPLEIIEGFQTKKGTVIQTSDAVSSKGDSRNLKLCVKVVGPTGERTMIASFNYRPTDFTPDRMAYIKEMRQENKGVRGAWADRDAQRSSLALAFIGGLSKAVGFSPKRTSDGTLVAAAYVGLKLDGYLGIDIKGFNEVRQFAAPGSKARNTGPVV
jgi:hypothetical protein